MTPRRMPGAREYQVGAEEVDVADVSMKESKGLQRRGVQFLEIRKVLETPMQDTVTARERKLVRRSVFETELCSCEFRVTRKSSLLGCLGSRTHGIEDGCHLKQAKDTKTGVASTAYPVSMFMK